MIIISIIIIHPFIIAEAIRYGMHERWCNATIVTEP
jgi:hypothetical protein